VPISGSARQLIPKRCTTATVIVLSADWPQRTCRRGLAWVATSLTRSVCRLVPVFANRRCNPLRHCERSEAIHATRKNGLLRRFAPRNDGVTLSVIAPQRVAQTRAR
jgi:hypothetical protein